MTEIYIYYVTYIYEDEAIRIPKSENNIGAPSAPPKYSINVVKANATAFKWDG